MLWDVDVYQQFAKERLRPAMDLLARIDCDRPARVVDLGCGPGNVTAALKRRWPDAEVVGIDASEEMLKRARHSAPECRFLSADVATWTPDVPPDVIYSNAALHWLGTHDALFPRLMSLLAPGGVLAVSMPGMNASPMETLRFVVATQGPWAPYLRNRVGSVPILEPRDYWRILSPHAVELAVWEATWVHALAVEDAVAHWAAGATLRSFIVCLPDEMQRPFVEAYAEAVRPHYPPEPDGVTLLPFRRVFMVARR